MTETIQDYCTAFPENLFGKDLSQCCKAHDLAYETQTPKKEADVALFNCVADSGGVGAYLVAALMFAGVSLFGMRFYKRSK